MKRIVLSLIALVLMVSSVSVTVSAAADKEIPGEGYVGVLDGDLGKLVKITLPSDFAWYIDAASYANPAVNSSVYSGEYHITNESERATLEVTLVEFKQTDNSDMSGLVLNLTGDLRQGAIGSNVVGYTGNAPYTATMAPNDVWEFGFNGEYNAGLPVMDILNPQYKMVLNFNVVSYAVP